MRTRISQAAAAIPLIGYAILWSRELSGYFVLRPALGAGLWFDTTERLLSIYFGAVLLATGWVVYLLRCPPEIKRSPVIEDYLSQEQQTHNEVEYHRILNLMKGRVIREPDSRPRWSEEAPVTLCDKLQAAKVREALRAHISETSKSTILQSYFLWNEASRFGWLLAAGLLIGIGSALLLLPSLEVFLLVVLKVLLPLLA